jgi:hypothetical protein
MSVKGSQSVSVRNNYTISITTFLSRRKLQFRQQQLLRQNQMQQQYPVLYGTASDLLQQADCFFQQDQLENR